MNNVHQIFFPECFHYCLPERSGVFGEHTMSAGENISKARFMMSCSQRYQRVYQSPHPEEILSLFHHECASFHLEFYKLWSSYHLKTQSLKLIIHLFVFIILVLKGFGRCNSSNQHSVIYSPSCYFSRCRRKIWHTVCNKKIYDFRI